MPKEILSPEEVEKQRVATSKFEPVLGEGPPPPPPPEDRDVEPPSAAEKRRKAKARDIGEVPPVPPAAKFPGEVPPYPPGYTPPEGKAVEFDAKGRPTVIETKAGLRQYTPNSTMFKMGYLTSSDYSKTGALADNPVAASAFLAISSEKGESLMIAKDVAFKLREQQPRQQFAALKEMGIIETGSRFIPTKDGKWSYQTAASVKAEKRWITKSAIFEQYDISQHISRDFKKNHIQLADGTWIVTSDFNKLANEYKLIGIKQGFDAMIARIGQDTKDFREVNTQLPDGTWFANADLMQINTSSPVLHDILAGKGYAAYLEAIDDAKATLTDFYDPKKDTYNVAGALLKRKPELDNAVNMLFSQQAVDRIKYEKMPGLTIGKPTPAQETMLKIIGGLAIAGVVTTTSPTPIDDIIIWTALGSIGIGIGIVNTGIVDEFMQRTGRSPTPDDIVVMDNKGKFATALEIMPELQRIPPLVPPRFDIRGETIDVQPTEAQIEMIRKLDFPEYREGIKAMKPEVVFLPTPATTVEDVTGQRAGFMAANAAVEVAEKDMKTATEAIEINWEKILEEAQEAKEQKDIEEIFKAGKATPAQVAPAIRRRYEATYYDYLRVRMLLESARQSYVASLNPSPLVGKITPDVLESYAAYSISEALSPSINSATWRAVSKWIEAYNKAVTEGATATQAKLAAQTAAQNAVQTALKNMAATKTLTQTQVNTLTRTLTRTAVRTAARTLTQTAVRTATRTLARPAVRLAVKPAAAVATATLTSKKGLLLLPGAGKLNRKRIRESAGAISWRQGKLRGKDIWHVLLYPYQSDRDYLTVIGRKPQGAAIATGKGSAYRTIRRMAGKPPARKVRMDMGAMDVTVSPRGKGVGIRFKPDPEQETTGDFSIGRRIPAITQRAPILDRQSLGISRGKGPRITPKTPRLRR